MQQLAGDLTAFVRPEQVRFLLMVGEMEMHADLFPAPGQREWETDALLSGLTAFSMGGDINAD